MEWEGRRIGKNNEKGVGSSSPLTAMESGTNAIHPHPDSPHHRLPILKFCLFFSFASSISVVNSISTE
jgi:hypothetical protein